MTNEITTIENKSVNNIDISSVIKEVIEYTKDQATITDIKSVLAEKAIKLRPIAMVKASTCKEFEYFLLFNSDQAKDKGLLAPNPSLTLFWKKLKIIP